MAAGRVFVAFAAGPLAPSPTWTRLDNTANLVAGIDISRGRQTETEQTDTSTATVLINDTAGLFDPDNASSPYFNKLDGRQIMLQLQNPVTGTWVPQWRGVIDDYGYDFNPAVNADGEPLVANIAIQCVDLMAYLAGVEMIPGVFGDTPPTGSEGTVFYEDADFQTRVEQLLTDAGVDPLMFVVFSGNVNVQETKYDPGDSILAAIRDALDAEFPGIANGYTDKLGRFCAHGRKARFDPTTVAASSGGAWDFHAWKAGDGVNCALDVDRAQIRPPLRWSRPRSRIVNAALCYPRGILEADIPTQIVTDAGSIAAYGYRPWSAFDLITDAGTTTGYDANDETKLFGQWKVANYKDPKTLVEALTFRSIKPTDVRGPAVWNLICNADISDVVDLAHGYPGGNGLFADYFIEGSQMEIRPLTGSMDDVTLTLNVSPVSDYADDVFTT